LLDGVNLDRIFAEWGLAVERHLSVDSVKLQNVSTGGLNRQNGERHLPLLTNPEPSLRHRLRLIARGTITNDGKIRRPKPTNI